jgi:hypothetical protein
MTEEVLNDQIEDVAQEPEQEAIEEKTPEQIEQERIEDLAKKYSQKRIDKVVAQRESEKRERERYAAEAAALRVELDKIRSTSKQEQVYDPEAPKPDNYDLGKYDPDFIRDAAKYEAIKYLTEQQKRASMEQENKRLSGLERQFAKETPDYVDVISEFEDHPLSNVDIFKEIINDSENPAKIKYYLAKNPEHLEKLGEMTPTQATRYIGKIEALLENELKPVEQAKKPVSTAPKPASVSTGGNPAVIKDPAKMSMEEYSRYTKEQRAARNG